MSSVYLAELCGQRHSDFKKKASKVIGEDVRNFSHISKDAYDRDFDILFLPEREACLMAMSYSYELQAKVYDAWKKSAQQITQDDQLLMLAQGVIKLTSERDEAIKTKAQINDKRTATIMGKLGNATKKISSLEEQLKSESDYQSVVAAKIPQRVNTELKDNVQSWRLLKQLSSDMQLTPKKIKCERYGEVLAYHVKVVEVFRNKYL